MLFLISDMFSKMRVASKRYMKKTTIRNSFLCFSILKLIQKLGYVGHYKILSFKHINLELRYLSKHALITIF